MVKQYARGHVVGVIRRVVQGSVEQVAALLQRTQGGGVINTAYSLRLPLYVGRAGRRHWVLCTPTMAAAITDHCWSVQEFLDYRVPHGQWMPPKRGGRLSNATKQLIRRWCG